MDLNFFMYNNRTGILEFNEYQILLVTEFAKLFEKERNKCKEDPVGIAKVLARKEFTYIWLKMHNASPYFNYSEEEAHRAALHDSKLTQKEFDNKDFRNACNKFLEIRDSDRISKMIRALYNKVDEVSNYFDNEVDFSERDNNGKPIFKLKDFQKEAKDCASLIEGIQDLELMYKRGSEVSSNLRSDAMPGYKD